MNLKVNKWLCQKQEYICFFTVFVDFFFKFLHFQWFEEKRQCYNIGLLLEKKTAKPLLPFRSRNGYSFWWCVIEGRLLDYHEVSHPKKNKISLGWFLLEIVYEINVNYEKYFVQW